MSNNIQIIIKEIVLSLLNLSIRPDSLFVGLEEGYIFSSNLQILI